jgi:hypothetical protein
MSDLIALAERVEALTGPCRETADDVMLAYGWTRHSVAGCYGWRTPEGRQCSAIEAGQHERNG